MIAFTLLKAKIAETPILKHFDSDRPPVIVVYASKWAISAALLQEHDGVYWPVTFSSRTLKPKRSQLRDGGERGISPSPDTGYLLYYASLTCNHYAQRCSTLA